MRTVLAWVLGIVVAGVTYYWGDILSRELHIAISGGEYMNSDGDLQTPTTLFGTCLTILTGLAGFLVGRMIYFNGIGAGFTRAEKYSFIAWALGTASMLLLSGLIQMAFLTVHNEYESTVQFLIEGLVMVGVAWAWRQWWKTKCPA